MSSPIEKYPSSLDSVKVNIATHFLDAPAALHPERIAIVRYKTIAWRGGALRQRSAWPAAAGAQLMAEEPSQNDPAFMLYTSGSGGTPKAAVHRHAEMVVTSRNYARGVLGLGADDWTFS